MKPELIERAKDLHDERIHGSDGDGPLFGARLEGIDFLGAVPEPIRCLMEYICALEARIEALEAKQQPEN